MRSAALILFSLGLAACDRAPDPKRTEAPVYPASPKGQPTSPSPTSVEAAPPKAAPDLSAPVLVPEAEKGEKGARNVLLEWARALERRDFARADAQWGEGAAQANSADKFAGHSTITVAIGDGDVEGAAGSLYYEVPVTVTGDRGRKTGTVAVRRVNDVDGASPAQLRWHLSALALEP